MGKKILYILNETKCVNNFSYAAMMAAKELGWDFHIAGKWSYDSPEALHEDELKYGISIYQIDFARNPLHPANRKAYKQLCAAIEREKFDIIHCNTPIGGICGRLAGSKFGIKPVIYQAHGFHFYKGAPMLNWLVYYPVEKILAHLTDALITINQEDYAAAHKLKLRNSGAVFYVPGVGIDTDDICANLDRDAKRRELGLNSEDFAVVSVGRLEPNKNNETLIRAISLIKNPRIKLVLCGDGVDREKLQTLSSQLGVESRVIFLGNRSDMKEIYPAMDILTMASFREGLSRTVMEGMVNGLPCIVSDIRGNRDLITDEVNGYLCTPDSAEQYSAGIEKMSKNTDLCRKMSQKNIQDVGSYSTANVIAAIKNIYREII